MKKVKDLATGLLVIDFKGVNCNISSQLFTGELEIKKVSIKDNGEFLEPSLVMDTSAGSLTIDLESYIEELDKPPYKWGYKIVGADIDNKPIENCFIEIGKKYTDDELFNMGL